MAGLLGLPGVQAATPSSGTVTATPNGSSTVTYSGQVPPGTGGSGTCDTATGKDTFTLTVAGTGGTFYDNNSSLLTARIEWDPTTTTATQDLALEVNHGGQQVGFSDGGTSNEVVAIQNPEPGTYQVITCTFAAVAPQPYKGQISLNTSPKATETLPAPSDPKGLEFMPIVTVDPQRDIAEPSLRYDKAGNIYTCGPFGASRAADYAQKSEDDGDTFRVLGEPPEGRIAPGGGGDCELATAPQKNSEDNYNLSYTGLEALANFSTGLSTDAGKNFLSTVVSESVPLVDRQWMEAHRSNEVYLFYNQIPFGGTLQHSTDGGLTYEFASNQGNAAPVITRPGNLVIDHTPADAETVYGTYTDGNKVKVFKATNNGTTFRRFTVATAKGRPDNLFPSIAIDTAENLYVAWIEKGSFNAYYSFSKDGGTTWSNKQLVNRRGAQTTVMPWIVAGSPGRIAVSFYCSPVDGNPEIGDDTSTPNVEEGFKGPWDVCMNQSLNALGQGADFSQVKVTHHPIHWDSICLSGLGCDTTGGDRTLLDFFQTRVDPRDGRVSVAFNESNKIARKNEVGPIAILTHAKQKSGPSLFASQGSVPPDNRAIFRSVSNDPLGDALFDFSSLEPTPPPRRENVNSLDFGSLTASGTTVNGAKAVKFDMKLNGPLTDTALTTAATAMNASQELKFVVRWFSGYRPDYAIANYEVSTGTWGFFKGGLETRRCETTADDKLEVYPAPAVDRDPIPGNVNETTKTITLKVPYNRFVDIDPDPNHPSEFAPIQTARSGDPIFEVTAFTFGRPQAGQPTPGPAPVCAVADYYNQADSTASFEYRLP
jgi:hypothetical protein